MDLEDDVKPASTSTEKRKKEESDEDSDIKFGVSLLVEIKEKLMSSPFVCL